MSARRVLHLVRQRAEGADAPEVHDASEPKFEATVIDELAAEELLEQVFAADVVVVW